MVHIRMLDPNSGLWVPVGDKASGLENNVPSDGVIQVEIRDYPHKMVTGRFFAFLPGYENGHLKLSARLTIRREG
jgi:hypothetical protein